MIGTWERIQRVVQRHRMVYGIVAALLIALLLTTISMALYVSSGASRLDLSRPGYERVRTDVQHDDEEPTFSATGPMSSAVADDFQARFTKHREALSKLDTFGTNALDDTELQIAPSN